MKKVAIVSCYYVKNYGSMLQAYAVQKMLDNLNIENENLQYIKSKNIKQYMLYAKKLLNKNIRNTQFKNLKKKIYGKIYRNKYGNNFKIRDKKFEEFKNNYFRISKPYYGYEAIKNSCNDYDAFILGSDQLWHPMNIQNHYFTMEFIDEKTPKITYAPSFGVSEIPKNQIKQTKKYLNRIDYISVREESGKNIVKQLTGRDVPVVLDPTFMIGIEEWNKIASKEKLSDKKYIFCYFLGDNKEHRLFANKLKEKTGYEIITLPHIDEIAKSDFEFGDIKSYDIGPREYINLIKNAEFVCTDSFHCTAFSIMYQKKFFTFNRFKDKQKASTNTRLKSILKLLKLEDRLILDYNDELNEKISQKIDYDKVLIELEKLRNTSNQYLKNALRNI